MNKILKDGIYEKALIFAYDLPDSNQAFSFLLKQLIQKYKIKVDDLADITFKHSKLTNTIINVLKNDIKDLGFLEKFLLVIQDYIKLFFLYIENYYRSKYKTHKQEYFKKAHNLFSFMKAKAIIFEYNDFYEMYLAELEKYNELKLDIMLEGLIDNTQFSSKERNQLNKQLMLKNQNLIDSQSYDAPLYSFYKILIKLKDSEYVDKKNKSSQLKVENII